MTRATYQEFKMEENTAKVNKKNKSGPLKSTPGFLKCLRNVYLYFKEEKEKGALNIPINSFIERTAVACGVGRKTLYNYAKKGLFDEHPVILQSKQRKKKGKSKKIKEEGQSLVRRNKKFSSPEDVNSSSTNIASSSLKKKTSPSLSSPGLPSSKIAKNAMIQTDSHSIISRPVNLTENFAVQNANPTESNGFPQFVVARDQKVQHLQVLSQTKIRETGTNILAGAWTSGTTKTATATIKRDVDYFSKNNIWHAVYNLPTAETPTCIDMSSTRITTCQQQPSSDHLTNL